MNQYTYSVPFTADELFNDYVKLGMTQREIGEKWGVSQKVVCTAMRKAGIKARKAAARNQSLDNNNNWRGGMSLVAATGKRPSFLDRGYRLVYAPNHSRAQKNGYVYEHILVAIKSAGIEWIPDGHCVHHINLRKDDNRPENLSICDHKKHQRFHNQLEELAIKLLLDTGAIVFDKDRGYVEA